MQERKLEIDMYWKRTTFFWTLTAAAITGFFAVINSSLGFGPPAVAVASLGLTFSFGWFLAARGSKYWQENWERAVDLIEDEVAGPVHKVFANPEDYRFMRLNGPYPFSVTKVNQLLGLFVTLSWVLLFVWSLLNLQSTALGDRIVASIFGIVTPLFVCSLGWWGTTSLRPTFPVRMVRRRAADQAVMPGTAAPTSSPNTDPEATRPIAEA